jgi:cell division protein FtsN
MSLFIDPIEKEREARAAEAARIAEAAREPAVVPGVLLPAAGGEPRGPWVEPIEEAPQPAAPQPEVLVKTPEEAGEPRGPWVEPAAPPAPEAPEAPAPPEVLVKAPEEAAEPRGPWVEPIGTAPPAPGPRETPPPRQAQTAEQGPGAPAPGIFSVPVNVISELETGKYYVQIGAYRSIASAESALLRIDPGYPLNVQTAGSGDNPVYRLLIGPLNLGESGALVQRFKGSGYRDAYVRNR